MPTLVAHCPHGLRGYRLQGVFFGREYVQVLGGRTRPPRQQLAMIQDCRDSLSCGVKRAPKVKPLPFTSKHVLAIHLAQSLGLLLLLLLLRPAVPLVKRCWQDHHTAVPAGESLAAHDKRKLCCFSSKLGKAFSLCDGIVYVRQSVASAKMKRLKISAS